ncbi:MAG TPA: O-antigen ligase family protein [Pseudomonadales bacterium]|nr:O-antigen ligase family protein [Pseudomonadales bacterium]
MVSRIAQQTTTLDRVVGLLVALSLFSVFLMPSQSGASFPTYVVAVLALVAGADRWRPFLESRLLGALFVALLLYFSSSVWWSTEHPMRSALSVYSRCLLIVTFVGALSSSLARIPNLMQWLSRGLAVSGGIAAVAALINLRLHPTWDGRLTGLGQLDNSVVAALAFDGGMLFALSCAIAEVTWWRAIGTVGVAVISLAVYATGSRNGYLAGAVGIWILIVTNLRPASPARLLWLAAPLLAAATLGIAVFVVRPEWQGALLPRGDSFRLEIWNIEWQRLVENGPWFGLGILTRDDVALEGHTFLHSHSLYLSSALQGGLVGLLLLLSLLSCAGWRLLQAAHRPEAKLGAALLATGMSAYLFDGWELIDKVGLSWLLLWVPVAIAMVVGVTSNMIGKTRESVGLNSAARASEVVGRKP